jgi:hypothetical protein
MSELDLAFARIRSSPHKSTLPCTISLIPALRIVERKKHASLTEITEMIASSGICKDSLATDEVQSLVQMLTWDGDLDEVPNLSSVKHVGKFSPDA